MDKQTQQGYIEKILYIICSCGSLDKYHLFKVMYFAQREFLAKYGMTIFPDDFVALPYGPVPRDLYLYDEHSGLKESLKQVISNGGEEAHNYLFAKRMPDMSYISTKAKETIDEAIKKYSTLSFEDLKQLSHTKLWEQAYHSTDHIMTPLEIAKDADASQSVIEYIQENEDFDKSFA